MIHLKPKAFGGIKSHAPDLCATYAPSNPVLIEHLTTGKEPVMTERCEEYGSHQMFRIQEHFRDNADYSDTTGIFTSVDGVFSAGVLGSPLGLISRLAPLGKKIVRTVTTSKGDI